MNYNSFVYDLAEETDCSRLSKINILFRHGVLLFQLFWKYMSICIAKVVIYLGYLQLLRAWSF